MRYFAIKMTDGTVLRLENGTGPLAEWGGDETDDGGDPADFAGRIWSAIENHDPIWIDHDPIWIEIDGSTRVIYPNVAHVVAVMEV